jgi:hypothetical protein
MIEPLLIYFILNWISVIDIVRYLSYLIFQDKDNNQLTNTDIYEQ